MNKIKLYTLFLFLSFQISFAQKSDVKELFKEASVAYENQDYETTIAKVEAIKSLFKSSPPPEVISMEILAKSKIIKNNPFDSYSLLSNTRNLADKYLKNPHSKKDKNFSSVVRENNILKTYPKDLVTFNAQKKAKIREEALQKEREEKEAAEAKVRKEKEEKDAKARQEEEAIIRQEKIKEDSIKNAAVAIEKEKNRVIAAKTEEENKKRIAKQDRIYYKNMSFRKGFSSLGIQSGEIAKYGLLYERGGKRTVGFHISARTSNTSEEDILNGSGIKNKTEIDLGPNFKLFNRIYFNIGLGYGYYDKPLRNDYAGTTTLEKTGYLLATSGVMIRISRVININGGVSFMDVDKAFYKPEITFGISFNLKKKDSY